MSTDHPQVTIIHPEYGPTEVDAGLAPLLAELWERKFDTVMSCQANEPWDSPRPVVWIRFSSVDAAEGFIATVATEFSDDDWSLYQRIRGDYDQDDDWRYQVHVEDWNVTAEFEPATDDPDGSVSVTETPLPGKGPWLVFEMAVRFPLEDLPAVYAAFGVEQPGR